MYVSLQNFTLERKPHGDGIGRVGFFEKSLSHGGSTLVIIWILSFPQRSPALCHWEIVETLKDRRSLHHQGHALEGDVGTLVSSYFSFLLPCHEF